MVASASMVTLVREAKGWSQTELAHKVGINQGVVSRIENGLAALDGERLEQFARALGCPPELLENTEAQRGLEVSCLFHRRRKSKVTVAAAKRIEAISHLTQVTVNGLLQGVELTNDLDLDRMDIAEFDDDPVEVARLLRAKWRIPSGPIPNIFHMLDTAGVVVVLRPVGTAGQDAFSSWAPRRPPLMVINTGLPVDRLRFTAAHELGHITMHVVPNIDQEDQANAFAAEFLMPAEEIRPQLTGLTTGDFNRLMGLKAQWRVSIAALIQRAHTLETISDRQYREFRVRLSQLGWHKVEPTLLTPEEPTLLREVIALHRDQHGYSDDELAKTALMTSTAFRSVYLDQPEGPQRPRLRVVR